MLSLIGLKLTVLFVGDDIHSNLLNNWFTHISIHTSVNVCTFSVHTALTQCTFCAFYFLRIAVTYVLCALHCLVKTDLRQPYECTDNNLTTANEHTDLTKKTN